MTTKLITQPKNTVKLTRSEYGVTISEIDANDSAKVKDVFVRNEDLSNLIAALYEAKGV